MTPYKSYLCLLCGYVYHEEEGHLESNIPAGTRWCDIDDDWMCPECNAMKEDFEMIEL